ncbi:MAG: hypothetical protein ACFCU1_11605 [Sumerlaeia bacterium]
MMYKLFLVVVIFSLAACAKITTTEVSLSEVPSNVEYTIIDKTENGIIETIQYQVKDSSKSYLVTYSENGILKKFSVDERGNLIE